MQPPVEETRESLAFAAGDQATERWVRILDDVFRIPFTNVRFGLDVVLGLLPVVGDVAGLVCGFPLLVIGVQRRLPVTVLLTMTLNLLVDAVAGSVPVLGNIFDIVWKAHRKNLRLVRDPSSLPSILREAGWSLVSIAGAILVLTLLLAALIVLAVRAVVLASEWVLAL